ncbi:ABC transporter substrate-binding protein [Salinactinospora qingdaonensis]|uniref:ABC transporter substrate-binding protein n=1 Tax=Salinactinospora qingdaonensis TaxID=702744 RepID=A0ABP7FT37_9ACTN
MHLARLRIAAFALAVLPLSVLTACGEPASEAVSPQSSASATGFPVTVSDSQGEVTLAERPQRIVSLSPSHTEMLFAIGAGDQVVAVDEHSTYPAEAPDTDLSGFTPSVEAITSYDPDLVVLARSAEDAVRQLSDVGIPALLMPSATELADTYEQIELLGRATGHPESATKLANQVESDIADIVEEVEAATEGRPELSFYHELDESMHSVSSQTFVGQVYERFGLNNIADAATDGDSGYPQLSAEFVVEANPDLIFLSYPGADGDFDNVESLTQRPAFDTITAVKNGDIAQLDPDTSSRWGPRVVDFARDVADTVIASGES